eukprot:scaffold17208_cov64-Cyclotella_meneghiniana.AAC.2
MDWILFGYLVLKRSLSCRDMVSIKSVYGGARFVESACSSVVVCCQSKGVAVFGATQRDED